MGVLSKSLPFHRNNLLQPSPFPSTYLLLRSSSSWSSCPEDIQPLMHFTHFFPGTLPRVPLQTLSASGLGCRSWEAGEGTFPSGISQSPPRFGALPFTLS